MNKKSEVGSRGGVLRWTQVPIGEERGVTGLETAIILIAFVVVASVFAFTVLSTGIFSSQRGKETLFAGLKEAQGSLDAQGAVIANGATAKSLSLANTAWAKDTTNATNSAAITMVSDTGDKKEGAASSEAQLTAAFTTGLAAYENLSPTVDLSKNDSVELWIKSSVDLAANDLQFRISSAANCGTSLEDINIPVLVASTWKRVTLAIADNSDMTAVKCIGLDIAVDKGAANINLDEVISPGQATTIEFVVTNGVGGEAVDLVAPSDSDADGISDTDGRNTLVLTYTDKNQVVSDIYWTKTFVGEDDGDDLLEVGEKGKLTVTLTALANDKALVKDLTFSLELKPAEGSVLVLQRTMPSQIDTVMNLK